MNKILRYSFVVLMAMLFANVFAEDVFVSNFSYATGEGFTGGGDGTFTGSVASKKIQSSNAEEENYAAAYAQFITQWVNGSLSNAYWANQSIKLGTASKDGSMTSIALGDKMESNVKVTINVAGWGSGSNSMTLAASKGTVDNPTVTLANGEFTDYTFIIAGGDATTALTISGKRMFIKSVKVETTSDTPVVIAVPEFSVAGGLYLETQSVAMSCEEGARILYTVAVGNDPEYIDDENYTGVFYDGNPLQITQSTIIKAMAVKNGKTSSIVTAKYTIVNTTGKGTVESPFSVADALLVVDALDNGQKTADEYVIKGSVTEVTEISLDYGNATFKIADAGSADVLTVFRAKDANGENITDENYVKVGDKVAVQGKLQKYVSGETVTPEVAQGGKILSVESEEPLPELPTVDQQPIYKFTAKGQWGSYTFNKAPFRAADYKGFRIEYSNMNEVSEGAAFNILINSNETHLGQDWSGAEAQVPNKTAYKNFGFDAAHTVFEGDFSDFVATDDPATTCPTIAQFALQACAAGNTVIIKKVVFIKQDNTEVLPEYKGDDWGGGAYTIEEVTDGINTINADKAENGVRYNLAGQKVGNGFKGVVIMNGKKMLQK